MTDGFQTENNFEQPIFVLVRPQLARNIGSSARAMRNFGLERMRLVAPRDGWPNSDAVATASGAGRLLDNAEIHSDLRSALADVHFTVSTTARSREMAKETIFPEQAMAEVRNRIELGQKVAVVFGPERTGLTNQDLSVANVLVTVPTNPEFGSLNLAQCVLLFAYEWNRQIVSTRQIPTKADGMDLATSADKLKLVDLYSDDLDKAGFFWPEEKADGMRLNLKNMFMRLEVTEAEVRTLHGVRRALLRGIPKERR